MDFLRENLNILLTISGLLVAAVGTIVEKLAPEHRRGTRAVLVLLAIAGFGVTACGAILQEQDDSTQKQQIGTLMEAAQASQTKELDARLDQIDSDLRAMAPPREELHRYTPPAPAPPPPPAAQEYFVQIAADSSAERLDTYAARLQRTYHVSASFAGVVEMRSGSNRFRLAFGQHLDKATAQKYVGIANSLGLPPSGQSASIQPQPK